MRTQRPSQQLKSDTHAAAWHASRGFFSPADLPSHAAETAPETAHEVMVEQCADQHLVSRFVAHDPPRVNGHDHPPNRPLGPAARPPPPPPEPTTATDGKMLQLIAIIEKAINLHAHTVEPATCTVATEGGVPKAVRLLIKYATSRIEVVDATTGRYGHDGPPACATGQPTTAANPAT